MQLEDHLVALGTVFVAHEEVKQTVGPKKVLKVFLIDKEGKKHLAATGEDLGDAHYHYRSTKPFSKYGVIDCHNRKELTMWLEMVIAESGGKEGPHLDADEQNPEGVYFTSHKYERAHMPDGRRINRWYLTDQHGFAHLAVIGVERDTKDGHYTYSAEEPFASRIPLQCSNQAGVFKWLEKWITHHAAGGAAAAAAAGAAHPAPSGTASAGTVNSAGGGTAGTPGRKPPLFISLSAIRAARKSAAALLAADAMVVDPQLRVRSKTKQSAVAAPAPQPPELVSPPSGPKQKSIGIVQQNQIKKARKLQEEARAEQDRLITGHLTRLRRAAATELKADNAAKHVTVSWLQGSLNEEEQEVLQHWVALLRAVLDLQQQHQQWQQRQQQQHQQQAGLDGAGQQQQQQQQDGRSEQLGTDAAAAQAGSFVQQGPTPAAQGQATGNGPPLQSQGPQQQQQQQQQQQERLAGPCRGNATPAETVFAGVEMTDKDLLAWLRQPGNERHHLRVMLECLKEIGAADLPSKVLLSSKVIKLVRRCLSEPADESVRSLAQHMLQRWKWQLAGHMQVLTNPTYMEDHLAVLDEDVAAGNVPLPQLPKHKQVLVNTQLPALPGASSGRIAHVPPAPSPHHHHQQQQLPPAPGSTPAELRHHVLHHHTPSLHPPSLGRLPGNGLPPGLPPLGQGLGHGLEGLNPAGFGLLNPGALGTAFSTPMPAMHRSYSPALAGFGGSSSSLQQLLLQGAGSSGGQSSLLQLSQLGCAQPLPSAADAWGLNGSTASLLQLPLMQTAVSAGLAGSLYPGTQGIGGGMVPVGQPQQQHLSTLLEMHQQQQQQLNMLSMQQHQQQHLQQQLQHDRAAAAAAAAGAAAAAAGMPYLLPGLMPQPDMRAPASLGATAPQLPQLWQQQWLGLQPPQGTILPDQQR